DKTFPSKIRDLDTIGYQSKDEHEQDLPFVVTTFGMLWQDSYRDPLVGRDPRSSSDLESHTLNGESVKFAHVFVEQVTSAVQEYQAGKEIFDRVFNTLAKDGMTGQRPTVYAHQVAEVGRRLIQEKRPPSDPQIDKRIENVLAVVLGDGTTGR